ncbi:hypothetical protein GobsT_18130 [Gemmata obscuriglobus]|nr:hypothetical protein [Gemmata obscuriglobus]QEG27060.1 hypothetical protein GobsT_18130 [Gemmata obscuriglobus]VTS03473.1 Uncharacterized protein OS=Ochrobactrum anthropi (strain ATCC 49188 / DSM 6882 / NCTC 12168) GN=Oant_3166 PE=4 SV=1 [Gemmata obscuriglobus UQM 2246]
MAHPYHHALSSVKRWGGRAEDYQPVHDWFDATKAFPTSVTVPSATTPKAFFRRKRPSGGP